jgi:hypothetical protein
MTPQQLHKIVFDSVKHVLEAAPGLSDLTRTSFATQAAVRITHHVKGALKSSEPLPTFDTAECLDRDEYPKGARR